MGMGTNFAELTQGCNKIVRDSRGNVALFDFYGALAAAKVCFQTLAGYLLWFY